jgi:hypothetical protein
MVNQDRYGFPLSTISDTAAAAYRACADAFVYQQGEAARKEAATARELVRRRSAKDAVLQLAERQRSILHCSCTA